MKKGFTLLELLVATMLLAMLVTALTMLFNQSAIAWRTGVAGVTNLHDAREKIARVDDDRDAALPGVKTAEDSGYRSVSLWTDSGALRDRAFDSTTESIDVDSAKKGYTEEASRADGGNSVSLFTVGVRSPGPDGMYGTEDDITTYPEELQ